MHKALVSYYMHRGYHNRIVLTDFGKGAAVNLHQLEKIHRNLYDVINKTDVSCCEVYVLGFSEYFRAVNNLKSISAEKRPRSLCSLSTNLRLS